MKWAALLAVLSGCALDSARIGYWDQLNQTVEATHKLKPEDCQQMGISITCTQPDGTLIAWNFTRDEAEIAEATVVYCKGEKCQELYRVRCDLAGCAKIGEEDTTWSLR